MTDKNVRGLMWAMLATLISGVAVFANSLVIKGIDPIVHTTVKNGMVGIAIVGLLLATGQWKEVLKLRRLQVMKLLIIALAGGSVSFAMFFTGLKMIGGVEGALIHKTLIFWVALMAIPLMKEKVSWKMGLAIILLYASNFVVGLRGFGALGLGHALVLGSTMLWSIESIIVKMTLKDVSANVVVAARMGAGSLILVGIMFMMGKAPLVMQLNNQQWLMLAGVAILLFGYVMSWYRALSLAPATQVAGMLVGATVVTSVLNAILVTHTLDVNLLAQVVIIVTGVWLVVMAAIDGWGLVNKRPALE